MPVIRTAMTKGRLLLISAPLVAMAIVAGNFQSRRGAGNFAISVPATDIVAGVDHLVVLRATPQGPPLRFDTIRAAIVEGTTRASIDSIRRSGETIEVRIRPAILAGRVAVEISAPGFVSGRAEFKTSVLVSDAWSDGTPDFLRLGPVDDSAFRNWFTYLAEAQYYRPAQRLSKEINDCAALIRFAYRESLRLHDAQWANNLDLDEATSFPNVRKYEYPYTPLGASLFRIRDGVFRSEDLDDGTFAEFADARTLQSWNMHFVSKDVRAAKRGDVFFYRQFDQDLPFHAMIFVGQSHFESGPAARVVYHTGPVGDSDGEIRRPTLDELLHHSEPRWRPVIANSSFLGVYRWNILR